MVTSGLGKCQLYHCCEHNTLITRCWYSKCVSSRCPNIDKLPFYVFTDASLIFFYLPLPLCPRCGCLPLPLPPKLASLASPVRLLICLAKWLIALPQRAAQSLSSLLPHTHTLLIISRQWTRTYLPCFRRRRSNTQTGQQMDWIQLAKLGYRQLSSALIQTLWCSIHT